MEQDGSIGKAIRLTLAASFAGLTVVVAASHYQRQASAGVDHKFIPQSHNGTKLKEIILAVIRKQRFERVTKNLKVTRVFSTLVEELKAINGPSSKAVIVEAHAFKEKDVIYRALNNKGNYDDMLQTAEYVHQSSTNAASSLLVAALNKG
ncbi:P-loop containing nucleoside triphosphate hydrolase superfamily protein [Trifolium repens]|nr:P-loop containing nucleoside triphosphate hydrolase superfamily protein [Trifolium repens]